MLNRDVTKILIKAGWTVEHRALIDLPPWAWRSPRGISGSDYRGRYDHDVPPAVLVDALESGDVALASTFVRDQLDDVLKAFEDERGADALSDTFWLCNGVTVFEALYGMRVAMFGELTAGRQR